MHDENDFLRKLLESPADDTVRLVYADWLDERGDEESKAKARFLRLTAQLLEPNRTARWRKARSKEMQLLAAALPTDWLAVVSRLKVEVCAREKARASPGEVTARGMRMAMTAFMNIVCDKRWDEMTATGDNTIRFCDQCRANVYYCDTIVTAREHALRGHCVAIDLGIIRRPDDIRTMHLKLIGRPSAAALEKERRRNEVDAVSFAREERKRNGSADGAAS